MNSRPVVDAMCEYADTVACAATRLYIVGGTVDQWNAERQLAKERLYHLLDCAGPGPPIDYEALGLERPELGAVRGELAEARDLLRSLVEVWESEQTLSAAAFHTALRRIVEDAAEFVK